MLYCYAANVISKQVILVILGVVDFLGWQCRFWISEQNPSKFHFECFSFQLHHPHARHWSKDDIGLVLFAAYLSHLFIIYLFIYYLCLSPVTCCNYGHLFHISLLLMDIIWCYCWFNHLIDVEFYTYVDTNK